MDNKPRVVMKLQTGYLIENKEGTLLFVSKDEVLHFHWFKQHPLVPWGLWKKLI